MNLWSWLQTRFPHRKDKVWNPKKSGPAGEVHCLNGEAELIELLAKHFEAKSSKSFMVLFPTNRTLQKSSSFLRHRAIGHFAEIEIIGEANFDLRLLTVWSAKDGEAEFAALVASSDMDRKMLDEDPRLEYVAVTRTKEVFYYVGLPMQRPAPASLSPVDRAQEVPSKPTAPPLTEAAIHRLSEKFGGFNGNR